MSSDPDKRFQVYKDLVLKRKIGEADHERERFATSLAKFLALEDVATASASDLPSSMGRGPRIDHDGHSGQQNHALWVIGCKKKYQDAKAAISSKSFAAIQKLFRQDLDLHTVGAQISRRPDEGYNRSINGATARAHLEGGADLLARFFMPR